MSYTAKAIVERVRRWSALRHATDVYLGQERHLIGRHAEVCVLDPHQFELETLDGHLVHEFAASVVRLDPVITEVLSSEDRAKLEEVRDA